MRYLGTFTGTKKNLLKLLSRFNLDIDQCTAIYVEEERPKYGLTFTDKQLIENPYLIYVHTRNISNPVSVFNLDRGMFPPPQIRDKCPLPAPSCLESGLDCRRITAFAMYRLEKNAEIGNTLQPRLNVVAQIREMSLDPACPVTGDIMNSVEPSFTPFIHLCDMDDGSKAYQLDRFAKTAELISHTVKKRLQANRHVLKADWPALLASALPPIDEHDIEQEQRARLEKTAALNELAQSRFSVLIGPAGTGKTTLLTVLCSLDEIAQGEILLLAPTGKARVRMEQIAQQSNVRITGFTLAQFLKRYKRYDPTTGRYFISPTHEKATPGKTVIVDESSMLTEEMLAALMDTLSGVSRLILVGDPRQLPPIGAGRPFFDIVEELKSGCAAATFPRVSNGYAELTVRRRQAGNKREDLDFAQWFSGITPGPGDDVVFEDVLYSASSAHIRFKPWDSSDSLHNAVFDEIVTTLGLTGKDDLKGFDEKHGAKFFGSKAFFDPEAAALIENWQVLSPVRQRPHGVQQINRLIHRQFRSHFIQSAQEDPRWRKYPKPFGEEQIVYGSKVINVINNVRKRFWPDDPNCPQYVANGEIGIVHGLYKTKNVKGTPKVLKVTFSTQIPYRYDYGSGDFREEGSPTLELAYALTVHKAQGSEFKRVILVLPNPCRLLSRELLYTALTRQKEKITVLYQGNRSFLRQYTTTEYSETARRITNLFYSPRIVEYKGTFYEDRLIHKTSRGEMVRSKSELIIADKLNAAGIDYQYELELKIGESIRYPDFTFEDSDAGLTYYWEHCGMLNDPEYRRRWENKKKWYLANDILLLSEGGGSKGALIVTIDDEKGGIASPEIDNIIAKIKR